MKKHTLMRRSAALVTSAGVAAALTLLSPVAANAAVHAQYAAMGSADADYTGPTLGGACNLTSPVGSDNVQTSISSFTHGTKHKAVNMDATFASTDNAADTVRIRGHVSSDLTVRRKHKDLTSFDFAAGGSVKITHSVSGSNCAGSGVVLGEFAITFTEHHKGFFYLTRTTKKPGSISAFAMLNAKTGKVVTLDVFEGTKSHQTSRALLKPGKYVIQIAEAGIQAGGAGLILKSGQPVSAKVARTIHLQGQFVRKH